MYTKIGLSLLAAAGLAIGVIGMQTSAATATTASCNTTPSTGANQSPAGTNSGADSNANASKRADTNGANGAPGTKGARGAHGATGANGTSAGNLIDVNAHTTKPSTTVTGHVSDPTNSSTQTTTTSNRPFLDVRAKTNTSGTTGAPVPPTDTHVVGRSSSLSGLLHVTARVNAAR